MRVGIVSDVHANLPALEAALAALARERVDRLVCAGDLVGYGPHPDECVERLQAAGVRCVAGNHDLIAIGALSLERTDALARRTLEWTREHISEATRGRLAALPGLLVEEGFVVAHGALDDPQRYVRSDADAAEQLERLAAGHPEARVLVVGHTHEARAYGARRGPLAKGAGTVALVPGEPVLLNPGSVGQARERRAVARAAVLDLGRGEARLFALRYDHRATARALVARGLPRQAAHRRPTLRARAGAARARMRQVVRP